MHYLHEKLAREVLHEFEVVTSNRGIIDDFIDRWPAIFEIVQQIIGLFGMCSQPETIKRFAAGDTKDMRPAVVRRNHRRIDRTISRSVDDPDDYRQHGDKLKSSLLGVIASKSVEDIEDLQSVR